MSGEGGTGILYRLPDSVFSSVELTKSTSQGCFKVNQMVHVFSKCQAQ